MKTERNNYTVQYAQSYSQRLTSVHSVQHQWSLPRLTDNTTAGYQFGIPKPHTRSLITALSSGTNRPQGYRWCSTRGHKGLYLGWLGSRGIPQNPSELLKIPQNQLNLLLDNCNPALTFSILSFFCSMTVSYSCVISDVFSCRVSLCFFVSFNNTARSLRSFSISSLRCGSPLRDESTSNNKTVKHEDIKKKKGIFFRYDEWRGLYFEVILRVTATKNQSLWCWLALRRSYDFPLCFYSFLSFLFEDVFKAF